MAADNSPGDSARRSRRGYRYQDVHALDRCLDVIDGDWDQVTVEAEEDVSCARTRPTLCERHEQVKTVEEPKQLWSAAKLCQLEKKQIDRSILGRLFLGKALHDNVTFALILNEEVSDDLRVLKQEPADRDADAAAACEKLLCDKLQALSLPTGFTVEWCVARLSIEVRSRTIEERAALLRDRLSGVIETESGVRPLHDELVTVLDLVLSSLQAQASSKTAQAYDRAAATAMVMRAWAAVDRPELVSPAGEDTSRLRRKVAPLGLDKPVADKFVAMHLDHRRNLRRADSARRSEIDAMVVEVFHVCTEVAVQRTIGAIQPGTETYVATALALKDLHASGGYDTKGFALADLQKAMWDVTSRCQHRFTA